MWEASLENGTIFLNGKEVECLKSFNIASSAEDVGIAELTMRMDVIINQTLIGSVEKEAERMEKYINALKGISYFEWVKLKNGIDRSFEHQKGEFEKSLKFADTEDVKKIIHSQFG